MVINRVAEAGGRGAGGFFGGIANNPGIVAIAVILGALVLFSGDIRKAFGSFGENFGTVQLPTIELPSFELPSFELPSFELPSFELPSFELPEVMLPDITTPVTDAFVSAGAGVTDFFGGLQQMFNEFVSGITSPFVPLAEPTDFTSVGQAGARGERGGSVDPIEQQFEDVMLQTVQGVTIAPTIETIAGFEGGGPSFIGGTINETPTEFLSLSQIINKFMVSATEAANIKLEAEIAGGELPGGFIPEGFFDQFDSNVSDPTLLGLTQEQIAAQLVGGNILNF